MLNVNFYGRLGADAELKKSQKGEEYYTFRVAVNYYNRGENSTQWVNVTVMKDRLGNRQLTKGSLVSVVGTETVSAYLTKNGEPMPDVSVFADRVDYMNVGSGHTQQNDAVAVNTDTGKFEKKTTKTSKPETKPVPQVESESDSSDDLPF
jgi:single-strand DNA-binding protein